VVPVDTPDDDPGRIRFDPLFRATYGWSANEVSKELVAFAFFGARLSVHRRVLPAFERARARLELLVQQNPSLRRYLEHAGGTFNWRFIAGTKRQSSHSYGISIDINTASADYWLSQSSKRARPWRNQIPAVIVDAFEAEGFIWGGRWYHYDTMHFEYRPELLDPHCH
jgi:hypothetical protein